MAAPTHGLKISVFVITSAISGLVFAQGPSAKKIVPIINYILFSEHDLPPVNASVKLNDTGIIRGGDYPLGKSASCTSNIAAPQDCHQGMDVLRGSSTDGHAGFVFTKLDRNGDKLPASAPAWSCVRDEITGLVWEVKTHDGSIHDRDNRYTWGGRTALGSGFGRYFSGWNPLVVGSNRESLCGQANWRLPTYFELYNLTNLNRSAPSIDAHYFPNTAADSYWTASPASGLADIFAWGISFLDGIASYRLRFTLNYVRLVSSGS